MHDMEQRPHRRNAPTTLVYRSAIREDLAKSAYFASHVTSFLHILGSLSLVSVSVAGSSRGNIVDAPVRFRFRWAGASRFRQRIYAPPGAARQSPSR